MVKNTVHFLKKLAQIIGLDDMNDFSCTLLTKHDAAVAFDFTRKGEQRDVHKFYTTGRNQARVLSCRSKGMIKVGSPFIAHLFRDE